MEEITGSGSIPPLRVGLTCNLKKGNGSGTSDNEAEYDSIETVNAIREALEEDGRRVELIEADEEMLRKLDRGDVDMVFNIAEGKTGRAREAQVPAILDFLGIPYTGSDATTLAIALDKALTKKLLAANRIKTPKFRLVPADAQPSYGRGFLFPSIVKPNAEGSSKGISNAAIARDRKELSKLLDLNIALYRQDMLVEQYINGREFTVGILGNGSETVVFDPMEIIYLDRENQYNIYSYEVKQNYKELVRYECPSKTDSALDLEIRSAARKIYSILGCRDFSRIDFRLSSGGELFFLEINPLPGLAPGYSDFPMLAEFNGMPYKKLVRSILDSALKRYGMHRYIRQE